MIERRKLRRRRLRYYLDVFDARTGRPFGRLGDISTAGLLLLTGEPVPPNRDHELEVRWQTDEDEPTRLRFRARSCWCRRDLNPDYYAAGFSIQNLDAANAARLSLLIGQLAFDEVA